jgi:hypothetical protein
LLDWCLQGEKNERALVIKKNKCVVEASSEGTLEIVDKWKKIRRKYL